MYPFFSPGFRHHAHTPEWHLSRGMIDANSEPLSLTQAKLHLRVDDPANTDDTLISALCSAVRQRCESETNRALVNSPYVITLHRFPRAYRYGEVFRGEWAHHESLTIPVGATVSNVAIAYVDTDGNPQTYANTDYRVLQRQNDFPQIVPAFGTCFPCTRWEPDAVTITFDASPSSVDALLTAGMRLFLTTLYEQRAVGPVVASTIPLPSNVEWCWGPYRLDWTL
jgi:uncharacterized phiE125 gp8 family phage protein